MTEAEKTITEAHRRSRHRLADRLRIAHVRLATLDLGLDIGRRVGAVHRIIDQFAKPTHLISESSDNYASDTYDCELTHLYPHIEC